MKYDCYNQGDRSRHVRNLPEPTSGKAAIWIDDDSGKIVDILLFPSIPSSPSG